MDRPVDVQISAVLFLIVSEMFRPNIEFQLYICIYFRQ